MKKNYFNFRSFFVFLAVLCGYSLCQAQPTVLNFSYTGSMQSFTVPSCVSFVTLDARGAQGGANGNSVTSTMGGQAVGVLSVTAGDVLNIFVGGMNGYNGGGAAGITPCTAAMGGPGGGASDVRLNGVALANRVIVGGGAGGSGGDRIQGCGRGSGGGGGGGYYGGGGGAGWAASFSQNSTGGTQTAGGLAGLNGSQNGNPGALGVGGAGGVEVSSSQAGAGTGLSGGAGGGLVGGNGQVTTGIFIGMSGGGGSSYVGTLSNTVTNSGVRAGNGLVTLTYNFNGNGVTATVSPSAVCLGSSASLTAAGMLSYTWSTGPNTTSIVVTPTATTSYTVYGTNSVNCVSSSVLTVTVSTGVPVLSVNTSTNITCLGKTVTLTATGALTYTWTGGVINGQTYSPTITQSYTVTGQNGCGTTSAVTTITVAPLPVTAVSNPTVICASQAATLTAFSAATGFTWTPFPVVYTNTMFIVNPSVTTVYTVTVSDGTCAGVANITLVALPVPTINIAASTSVVCEGYPVTMTVTGGTGYTWSPNNSNANIVTVMPMAPTLYTVVATNSLGCFASMNQIVLTNQSPTVVVAANPTLVCPGGQANLVANGATSYVWSNGPTSNAITVNPTVTTTYSVIGSDPNNTCTATKSITIVVFSPTVLVTGASTVCSGNNATLTASGGDTYNWDNGSNANLIVVSPSVTTTYTLTSSTGTINNLFCNSTNTVQVFVNPKPPVTAATTKTAICKGESVSLTAGGAVSYQWSTGSNSVTISVSPTLSVLYTYSVIGTDANNCSNTASVQVKVNPCPGIVELNNEVFNLRAIPNPNTGDFVLTADRSISLQMTNEIGQVIGTLELNDLNNYSTTVKELPAGIYFVAGQAAGHKITQKIVVTR